MNALPLNALFHSFTQEQNLWFLGGLVVSGAPGGLELVKQFGAKWWLGAHDERKNNRGLSVRWIKTKEFAVEDVRDLVKTEGLETRVVDIGVGGETRIAG
jgi:hypothetical protein